MDSGKGGETTRLGSDACKFETGKSAQPPGKKIRERKDVRMGEQPSYTEEPFAGRRTKVFQAYTTE